MNKKKIIVLGAGISGLVTAYLLAQKGYDVTVIEKKSEPGGSIETVKENGYLFDRGPNSALETTPVISKLIDELNLHDQLVYANKAANKRYILRNNRIHSLPMNPIAFLKTGLFSTKAKLRLFAEPFIAKSKDGYYQSVAEFVTRRLGKEFLDYAINPFVAGVYAGRPEELSVKSAFPKLYALEEIYGGLIVGTIKSIKERKRRDEKSKQSAKMLSFKDGMQVLPLALAKHLGERVLYNSEVDQVTTKGNGYIVSYTKRGERYSLECDSVISTLPAYIAANIIKHFDEEAAKRLMEIYYPPVLVLYVVYAKKDISRALDGFGFLIPSRENKSFLGAIWSSIIFPGRSPDDKAAFTLFIGGARNPEIDNSDVELLIKKVLTEFNEIMEIKSSPIYSAHRYWAKAIPQYNLGYIEHENYFDEFEKRNPGIILSGNYRGGISVGDCIKNAAAIVHKL
jgi:oxygen-dependent protoporphyrinogen oxidase